MLTFFRIMIYRLCYPVMSTPRREASQVWNTTPFLILCVLNILYNMGLWLGSLFFFRHFAAGYEGFKGFLVMQSRYQGFQES